MQDLELPIHIELEAKEGHNLQRIKKLEKVLRIAVGIISTYPPFTDKHPLDVYDQILQEANEDEG